MLTKIMKWSSAAILLPALFGKTSEGYLVVLQLVVTAGAILVVWQCFQASRKLWAIGFAAIAVIYNPFQALLFGRGTFLLLSLLSIAAFLTSLVLVRSVPKTPALSVIN